jgi:N-acetylglucosamine kinase-like BadF-type ATPase
MLFLGVDGGQSSTTAVIGDETGRVLGRGEAGPCNHVGSEAGRARMTAAVQESVGAAVRAARLTEPVRYASACFGMSGGPEDKRDIIATLVDVQQLEVTDDARIALLGATAGEPGIIVIAGTGSIAWGRNAAGLTARAGGWGYIFGDEGSGFDLARQALRAILRHAEGWGPATALGPRLLAATGAGSANELLHLFYQSDYPRDRVAGFAPLLDEAATEGDAISRNLLQQAAQQLATLVASVRSQLFQAGETVYVATTGGVFHSRMLAEFFRILVELEPGATVGHAKHEPAWGALLAAYRQAGLTVTPRTS